LRNIEMLNLWPFLSLMDLASNMIVPWDNVLLLRLLFWSIDIIVGPGLRWWWLVHDLPLLLRCMRIDTTPLLLS